MENDPFLAGNVLFSDGCSVKTTNGTHTVRLVGKAAVEGYNNGVGREARFRWVTGFAILSSSAVLLADQGNYCFRLMDRMTLEVTDFAGSCSSSGLRDGIGTRAKFSHISKVILDQQRPHQKVYVTDGRALRTVDINTRRVATIPSSYRQAQDSLAMVWDNTHNDSLIITTKNKVFRLSLNGSATEVAGTDRIGFKNGQASQAQFNHSSGVAALYTNIFVLTDQNNQRLRLLDLKNKVVTSFCKGNKFTAGPMTTCELSTPSSVLFAGDKLYIGMRQKIAVVPGKKFSAASLVLANRTVVP